MSEPIARTDLVKLIAGREIGVKLTDKSFLASTAIFVVIIIVSIAVPALIASGGNDYTVAATSEARDVADAAAATGDPDLPGRPPGVPEADVTVQDAPDVESAVADPDVTAVVSKDGDRLVVTARESVPDDLLVLLTRASAELSALEVADEAGLSQTQLETLLSPEPPQVVLLDPPPDYAVPPQLLILVFGFLFYFSVLTFGISIAQSVVEEKQSRVVELLVAAVPLKWLLAGKVLGNAVMAIGQVVAIVGAGLVGAAVVGQGDIVTQVLSVSGWYLAFFVLGFLMLACLWAVAGSLASRLEELQSTTLYMQLAVMIPFFVAIFVQEEGPARVALSYFPLTAPLMMPSRIATGDAAMWEPWVAMLVVAVTAVVLVGVGARLYAGSVLNTSKQTSVKAAWRQGQRV